MANYLVTGISARLSTGVLKLTKAQASARSHNLKALGGDRYEIVNPVEFKAGEVIGYEGELPKALASVVEPEEKAEAAKPRKPKAEASTKAEASGE